MIEIIHSNSRLFFPGIIEKRNSFQPEAQPLEEADGTFLLQQLPWCVTVEEKILKKQDLKARSILMMTLPSEIITPERELNLNFKNLPTEWEVKRRCNPTQTQCSQKNLAFVSCHSSTNDGKLANVHVSTGSFSLKKTSNAPIIEDWFLILDEDETVVLRIPYVSKANKLITIQTILGQTTTGKESSNPFMAGSLPKTISPMIHISQEVILLKEERTVCNL
ncbi:hypothetical protein Tco_1438652 [Tanacetum coccineum]